MHLFFKERLISWWILLGFMAMNPLRASANPSLEPERVCEEIAEGCSQGNSELNESGKLERAESGTRFWVDNRSTRRELSDSTIRQGTQRNKKKLSSPDGFTDTVYYGKTIMTMDLIVAGIGLTGLVVMGGSDAGVLLVVPAGIVYLVGAPFLHLSEGNPGGSLGSLLLRAGLPIGGFLIPMASASNWWEGVLAGGAGALAGLIAAPIIDSLFLAKKTVPRSRKNFMSVTPTFSITREGSLTWGLAGRF